MHLSALQIAYVIVLFWKEVVTSHFRGGTISWKPIGNGTEVINHNFNDLNESESNYFFSK